MDVTYETAEAKRNAGMERAVEHADRVVESWSDEAYRYLQDFCRISEGERFIIEDARLWAAGQGFESPTDERAWGAVIRRAAANGMIRKVGYAPARSSNLSPKCQWEAV